MLTGIQTGLRALEREDLGQLLIWRNNASMRRYYREYRELNMWDQERWFAEICCGNRNFCMFGIVALAEGAATGAERSVTAAAGELIGAGGLTNINWISRSAELSFYIGANEAYVDAVYAPEAARLLCDYAFDCLNLHKVWAEIYDFDQAKIGLVESMRMRKDGVLRDNVFAEGGHHDSYVYSLLRAEYRQ